MTVDELLTRISSKELSEWMAFDSLEPISAEWRADLRNAVLCAHLASLHGSKSEEARTPRTYMPDFDGSKVAPKSPSQMLAVARGLAAAGLGVIQTGG